MTVHVLTRYLPQSRRQRQLALEILFGVVTLVIVGYLVVRALGLDLSYSYLSGPTGFQIGHEWLTSAKASDSRRVTTLVAIWNTLRLVAVGIVLATVLGVVMGMARLSTNWLVRTLGTLYVEIIRNTPLLVQVVFWYFAVFLSLPRIENSMDIGGVILLSNRALVLPSLGGGTLAWVWAAVLVAAVVVAYLVRRWRVGIEDRTGTPGRGNLYGLGVFLVIAVIGYFATGMPVDIVLPEMIGVTSDTVRYEGGISTTPEFAAVLIGLVIYTGAFIAEIVRGAVQSLPRGQFEAASALGLSGYQRTTLVILPQALRTIIPPMTNQYLNLLKNSSLAVAVAYPEIVFVNRTFINSTGHAVPVFIFVLVTYMVLSLIISVVMNVINSRVQMVGR